MRRIAISKGIDYIFLKKKKKHLLFSILSHFFFFKKKDKERKEKNFYSDSWSARHIWIWRWSHHPRSI
jgi:hypothetical protein